MSKARTEKRSRITTISLRPKTYERLNKFRRGGETWDEFLVRVVRLLEDARES